MSALTVQVLLYVYSWGKSGTVVATVSCLAAASGAWWRVAERQTPFFFHH